MLLARNAWLYAFAAPRDVMKAGGRYLDVAVTALRNGRKTVGHGDGPTVTVRWGKGLVEAADALMTYGSEIEVVPEYPAVPIATNDRPVPTGLTVPMSIMIV